jgi:tripartite-type tricarboxylate transporter receptor subunit TctC
MVGWHGVFAPPQTPKAVVAKMSMTFVRPRRPRDPEAHGHAGDHSTALSSDEFAKVMRTDQARWGALIKMFNIQAD